MRGRPFRAISGVVLLAITFGVSLYAFGRKRVQKKVFSKFRTSLVD